jgi:hypothetical protein
MNFPMCGGGEEEDSKGVEEEDNKGAEDSKGVEGSRGAEEGSIEGSIHVTDTSAFWIIFYSYDTLCVVCGNT